MSEHQLEQRLKQLADWKQQHKGRLQTLANWLKDQGLLTRQAQRALRHGARALSSDEITVAVVGEFSRGKTELINALFFCDHGRRLLPTTPGRTTMCPTEIFQDEREPPYLSLLPIDTRLEDSSLAELRRQPTRWQRIELDLEDPAVLEEQLLEVTATLQVPSAKAQGMGLAPPEIAGRSIADDEMVEIPRWRLALINFRHPLLAKGLRILDTPGLNALGSEPELTYEMLPSAQALLFVLGADTGITQSDMSIWQQFTTLPGSTARPGIMAVLNKIDTLWDELRSAEVIKSDIRQQRLDVARQLGLSDSKVLAVSAQKGLLARIREDAILDRRSGIPKLEKYLAKTLVNDRQGFLHSECTNAVRNMLSTLKALLSDRELRIAKQAEQLRGLSGQSSAALQLMMREAQRNQQQYKETLESYKKSRDEFEKQGRLLLGSLDLGQLDQTIEQARKQMAGAWTTRGLQKGMATVFTDMQSRMQVVNTQSQNLRRVIRAIYRRLESHHGIKPVNPPMISSVKYQVELDLLAQEAEIYRKSPVTAITAQNFVVRRYFKTQVDRARNVFVIARQEASDWLGDALTPITVQIRDYKDDLSQQIKDLKETGSSRQTLSQRILELELQQKHLQEQQDYLDNSVAALSKNFEPAIPYEEDSSLLADNAS